MNRSNLHSRYQSVVKLLMLVLAFCCPVLVIADDVIVAIDPNSTDVTTPEKPVTSLCTVLSVPDLKVLGTATFGQDVAGAFIHHDLLVLTGQTLIKDTAYSEENFNISQVFAYYSLHPFAKVAQTVLPGYLFSSAPLNPSLQTFLHGGVEMACAVFQQKNLETHKNGAQSVLGITEKGVVFTYAIPPTEEFLTDPQPLGANYWLLHVEHSEVNSESALKLFDITSRSIVSTVRVTHVRAIIPIATSAESCFALLDRPGIDSGVRLALITRRGSDLTLGPEEMPIGLDLNHETDVNAVALNSRVVLIGVGPNISEIKDLYLVDWDKRTSIKVRSFEPALANFALAGNGKYLITLRSKEPQVELYDLASFKLLSTQRSVGVHPVLLFAN